MADEPTIESGADAGAAALIGKTIAGRYAVEGVVDATGDAVVYRARHTVLGKRVALKLLPAGPQSSPANVDSFLERVKLAASLGGPHVNRISDFGQSSHGTYVVMDWLDGKPLSSIGTNGEPLALDRLLDLVRQVAKALGAAHAKGVMHGRLALRHLVVVTQGTDERVKVLGFGEPLGGEQDAALTDVRALGLVLLELAGTARFDSAASFAVRKQREPVLDAGLGEKISKLPAALQAIALKAVDRQGPKSYRRVEDMADDLEKFRSGEIPDALIEMITSGSWALLPESADQVTAKRVAALLEPAQATPPATAPKPTAARVRKTKSQAVPKYAVLVGLLVLGGLLAGWFGAGWLQVDASTSDGNRTAAFDTRPFGPDE